MSALESVVVVIVIVSVAAARDPSATTTPTPAAAATPWHRLYPPRTIIAVALRGAPQDERVKHRAANEAHYNEQHRPR